MIQKNFHSKPSRHALRAWLLLLCSHTAVAGAVFTIDPAQSRVTVSGAVLGFPFQEQGPGSLTTTFEGTIQADVTDSTIRFNGGSAILPRNSGDWQPKRSGEPGSDPANYGGKASLGVLGTVIAAVRTARFDVTSQSLALLNDGFNARFLTFESQTNNGGFLDYSVAGPLPAKGSISLAGIATNRVATRATLVTSGTTQILTIPLTAECAFKVLNMSDTILTLDGQLVATRRLDISVSFESWVSSQFGAVADAEVIGAQADPDEDKIPNLVEYAFGLDPRQPNARFAPLQIVAPGASAPVIEFIRPAGREGVRYLLSLSEDLKTWAAWNPAIEVTALASGEEKVTIRDSAVTSSARFGFVSLVVARP